LLLVFSLVSKEKLCQTTSTVMFNHQREDLMKELFFELFEFLKVLEEHQVLEEQDRMSIDSYREFVDMLSMDC
jgi:hypothetical protein